MERVVIVPAGFESFSFVPSGRRAEAQRVMSRIGSEALERTAELPEIWQVDHNYSGEVLWLGIVLAMLQQIAGINVILYNASEVFSHMSRKGDTLWLETVLVGIINMLFTILAVVDRVKRKPLLIGRSLGMGACLVAMGAAMMRSETGTWLLIFVLGCIACFALSVGPVTWIVLSEIYPAHCRDRAMAIASTVLGFANFIVSQTFPMLDQSSLLIRHFGHAFSFFIYAVFCLFGAWYILGNLPETRNRSLEEPSSWWNADLEVYE
jgi:MFS family permease